MSGPRKTPKTSARRESKKYGSVVDAERLTVSQLTRLIDETLKDHVPRPIRVVGEVSGLRDRSHLYFDLKDADAVISCVAFANVARRISFEMTNGLEIVVSGRVEHYAKQGKTQLYASKIEPVGAGALEQAFRKLCEDLRALGYFDPSTKLALPTFPRRVAVVTSRTGAALQDVLDTIRRRCPAVEVAVVDVRVQGDEAAGEIARAIHGLERVQQREQIDAIILTRGGGSMEDLWAFNDREVARAIVECEIPVVAAIGHETDTTIAEIVADARGATPTQAVMLLTPDGAALTEQVDALAARLRGCVRHAVELGTRHVESLAARPSIRDPRRLVKAGVEQVRSAALVTSSAVRTSVADRRGRLEALASRLERHRPVAQLGVRATRLEVAAASLKRALALRLARQVDRVEMAERELRAVGPISVLERGYSCTTTESGSLVRSRQDVRPGDIVRTRLADGSIVSRVVGGASSGKPRARQEPDDQMDLFAAEP